MHSEFDSEHELRRDPAVEMPDPSVLQPRFELWVHGSTGLRVFNPYSVAVDNAIGLLTKVEGLEAIRISRGDASFNASPFSVDFLYSPTWPALVPGIPGGSGQQRPKPTTAMVLYRTRRATITTVRIVDGTGRTIGVPSDGALNWAGDYLTELGDKTVTPLTLSETPKFGLTISVSVAFQHIGDGSAAESSVRIGAVGIVCRIPSE